MATSSAIYVNGVAKETSKTSYYPETSTAKGLPYQQYRFGQLVSTNEYNTDGTLKKTTYNGVANRWVSYSDYYRGVPRNLSLPHPLTTATVSARLEVDSYGRPTRVTDFNGQRTDYAYDAAGRVTLIDPYDSRWANTVIDYPEVNGYLSQAISQGNSRKVIYFDGLLRPTLTKTWDASDEANTVSYVNQTFDHNNNLIFASVPSRSSSEDRGTHTEYDALGRAVKVTRPDGFFTTTEYLNGHQTLVTDAKDNQTTTSYLAYGAPSYDKPLTISSPEGVTTTLTYNVFGNVSTVKQGTITELRLYDSTQRLCLLNRPDVGSTAFAYNNLGEKTYQVDGLSWQAGCINVAGHANKTAFSYNNHGLVSKVDYADSSDDVSYGYDNMG